MTRSRFLRALMLAAVLLPAAAASAQPADEALSFRPFFVVTGEMFAAKNTFKTVFGQSFEPFWGGGLELVDKRFFVDVTASRFSKTGERAFFANGQGFRLGIPLKASLTPIEFTFGYRFPLSSARVVPYVGGGVGSYGYHEESDTTGLGPSETSSFDARHVGYLAVGGAEVRVGRWVAISGDAQYTHVPGIFGSGGVSQQAGESDLGGIAVRARVIVGR